MDIPYDYDVAVLKQYGDYKKITLHSVLRRKGFELDDNKIKISERGTVNEEKLDNSISRARSKIQEYVLCNDFQWFATFTINKDKFDRYNLKVYYSEFSKWLRNMNKRRLRVGKNRIRYLQIPEMHIDGAWHLHSLLMGIDESEFIRYSYDDFPDGRIPKYIRNCLENDIPIYYWKEYVDKFGYTTITSIKCKSKVANYIIKYCSKDMTRGIRELNYNLYYCSQGLKIAEEIKRGRIVNYDNYSPQYKNEYIKVKWYNANDDLEDLKSFISKVDYNRLKS